MSSFHARRMVRESLAISRDKSLLARYVLLHFSAPRQVTVKGGHWVGRPAMGISCSGNYVLLSLRLTKRPESRSIMSYIKRHLRKAIAA